jgi:hypothetical protein
MLGIRDIRLDGGQRTFQKRLLIGLLLASMTLIVCWPVLSFDFARLFPEDAGICPGQPKS